MEGKLKTSEARIIVYLDKVRDSKRYAALVSAKLDIDLGYTHQILRKLRAKGWVSVQQFAVKKYYYLTKSAPLKEAKKKLSK